MRWIIFSTLFAFYLILCRASAGKQARSSISSTSIADWLWLRHRHTIHPAAMGEEIQNHWENSFNLQPKHSSSLLIIGAAPRRALGYWIQIKIFKDKRKTRSSKFYIHPSTIHSQPFGSYKIYYKILYDLYSRPKTFSLFLFSSQNKKLDWPQELSSV